MGQIGPNGWFLPSDAPILHSATIIDATAMAMRDNEFEPKPGKIRSTPSKLERRYLQDVLTGIARSGGKSGARKGRFNGTHGGRGSGTARVLRSRDRYAAFRARRVIVKSRIVKLKGKLDAAQAHLRYIQRDGVTREGAPGALYDAREDRADDRAFLERCGEDRHQFRFIVSADDASEYDDLKGFTRRLMRQMETDLGTRLDWVAVDHHNTGHPHSHVILRGKDDRGQNLVIAPDYISHGMRERAAEIVTLDLGPRSDLDIRKGLEAEVAMERYTSLDRRLKRAADERGIVGFGGECKDAFEHSLRAGRLQVLKRLELAEELAPGQWRLADNLELTLRAMGERGDIIKMLHREMKHAGLARGGTDATIYDPADGQGAPLVGHVVARGLADELKDRHYLIVDAVDGRTHYVDIGDGDKTEPIAEGSIVAITPKRAGARQVDRSVAEIAAAHEGRYSVAIHMTHDRTATQDFAETHVRRLEAMRRKTGLVEREPDGTWIIAPDHIERARQFERSQVRAAPVQIEMLSALSLEHQVGADGATWLDHELVARAPMALRDVGFGKQARAALARRQQWLIEQGLAEREQDQIIYRSNLLAVLRRRELSRVGDQLSDELGLSYADVRPGARVEGVYRRPVDLASGRYALIEKSREFTLVPWRPVLERSRGREVSGVVRSDTISWTLGRQRSGPSIS